MAELTRREFIRGAAAAAAAGAILPGAALASSLGEELRAERPTFTLPDLHPAHDGLRVAQISDIHVGRRTPPELVRSALRAANAFRPDLIVLTGDYLTVERRGVGLMRELLGGLEAPTVAVLGNHDHRVDQGGAMRSLRALGYAVLRNQNTTLTLRGEPFTVVGIDDLMTANANPAKALEGARARSRLVIAHGPRTADLLKHYGTPMLCLSGHTHGGQLSIPGITSFLLRAVAHEPYDRGLFQIGAVQLYVNRGIGYSSLGVRVNSDPEVTLATLRSGLVGAGRKLG